MPIRVQGPDGRIVEFPDGTDRETMQAAMQRHYGGQQRPDFSNVQSLEERYADLQRRAAELPQYSPTDGMSGTGKFLAGVGKAFVDTGRGLEQLYAMAADRVAPREQTMSGLITGQDNSRSAEIRREIDASRQRDAALMGTGAGLAGNVAGYASQFLVPGGVAARGTLAARAALPTTVAGNAAQGGLLGMLQPVGSGDSRLANTGMGVAFGAGGAGLARLLGAGYRAGRGAIGDLVEKAKVGPSSQRAGEILLRESGALTDPSKLAALLRPAESAVPGVTRTLGEQSLDPGTMALENAMRARYRGVFDPVDLRNNTARVDALRGIAGDDVAMDAAEQARASATRELRDRAFAEGDETTALAMQAGFSPLDNVAILKDRIGQLSIGQGGRSSVRRALDDVVSELDDAEPSVQGLYNVRKSINDLIEGKAGTDKGYAKAATRELMQARDILDEEIANFAPSFGDYLGTFRQMSAPINRMEVGRDLINRGSASVLDSTGTPRLLPGTFAKTNDLDVMAQRATGFRKAKAEDILTPDDLSLIASIQDDLQRQFARQSSATAGSQTFERGEIAKRVARRGMTAIPFGIGSFVEGLQKAGADRVQEKLAYLLANPDEARRVLQVLEPRQRSAVTQALSTMAGQGTRTGSVSLGRSQE